MEYRTIWRLKCLGMIAASTLFGGSESLSTAQTVNSQPTAQWKGANVARTRRSSASSPSRSSERDLFGCGVLPQGRDSAISSRAYTTDGLPDSFFREVGEVSRRIGCRSRDLLAVMMRESGLRADARNRVGNAVGLIQFLPGTLARLGWLETPEEFRALNADEQLPWIEKFLRPSSRYNLNSAGRIYQAIFMPASLRTVTDNDTTLIDRYRDAERYQRNRGMDIDGDGRITVGDLQQTLDRMSLSASWRAIEDRLTQNAPEQALQTAGITASEP